MKRNFLYLIALAALSAAAAGSSFAANTIENNTLTPQAENGTATRPVTPSDQQVTDQVAKDKEMKPLTASEQQDIDQAAKDKEMHKRRIIQRLKTKKAILKRKTNP